MFGLLTKRLKFAKDLKTATHNQLKPQITWSNFGCLKKPRDRVTWLKIETYNWLK